MKHVLICNIFWHLVSICSIPALLNAADGAPIKPDLSSIAIFSQNIDLLSLSNTFFNRNKCVDTKAALAYACELHREYGTVVFPAEKRYALMQEAWHAVRYGGIAHKGPDVRPGVVSTTFSDMSIIAHPAFDKAGQFIAMVTSNNKVLLYDTKNMFKSMNIAPFPTGTVQARFIDDNLFVLGQDTFVSYHPISYNDCVPDLNSGSELSITSMQYPLSSNSTACALDTTHEGGIAIGCNHAQKKDGKFESEILLGDIYKSDNKANRYSLEERIRPAGLTWNPSKQLLAVKLMNNTVKLLDLRIKGPNTHIIEHVNTAYDIDFDGNGDRLCSANNENKLMVYDINAGKTQETDLICAKPGIIMNHANDYFVMSCEYPDNTIMPALFNINDVMRTNIIRKIIAAAPHEQLSPSIPALTQQLTAYINLLADAQLGGKVNIIAYKNNQPHCTLQHMAINKNTGQHFIFYGIDQDLNCNFVTHERLYETRITDPKPHNIACLYAFQTVKTVADWKLFNTPENKHVVQDTCEKDPIFRHSVHTFVPDTPTSSADTLNG